MALSKEQVQELKKQLTEQIQHLPEDRKAEAQEQIDALTEEDLEQMIKEQKSSNKPIFRSIVSGEVPAKKIEETKHAVAALDIKPISKGHVIIIPKNPIVNSKDMPSQVFSLAKKIAKRISKKLKSKSAEIQTEFKFGEIILNVIPVYDKALSLNSPRTDLEDKIADELHSLLKTVKKERKQVVKKVPSLTKELIKLKRRIP